MEVELQEKFEPLFNFKKTWDSYGVMLREFWDVIERTWQNNTGGPPDFTITLWGSEVTVVNWDVIQPYLAFVQSILIAIVWVRFAMWLPQRLAVIIHN